MEKDYLKKAEEAYLDRKIKIQESRESLARTQQSYNAQIDELISALRKLREVCS